jgi:3-methyladenine DNA glycosylase AlkD
VSVIATPPLEYALAWLEKNGSKAGREGLKRFNIPSDKAYGVPMGKVQALAKQLGRNHELALALWETDRLEARLLCAYVDEPERVTIAQMERWRRQFDNWAVVDTLCFALFDRTPHAWKMVPKWAGVEAEFGKRAGYALAWSLAVHDKTSDDALFRKALVLIEQGAQDERHFVKKAVNMALRAIGKRNLALNKAAIATARKLAGAAEPAPRWVGKDALRELSSAGVASRLGKK